MSIALLTVFCLGGSVFLCCFFLGLCREFRPMKNKVGEPSVPIERVLPMRSTLEEPTQIYREIKDRLQRRLG